MKSAIFVAATSAILALAGPVNKRKVVTDVVMVYETVTVTDGAAAATSTPAVKDVKHKTKTIKPSTTSSTSSSVVVVTVTPSAEPTTSAEVKLTSSSVAASPVASSVNQKQAATAASSSAAAATDLVSAALYHHNIHRANHSVPEVGWASDIAGYAAITGKTCTFAHDTATGGGGYGQNIAMYASSSGAAAIGEAGAIAMAATNMWYNGEINQYPGYGSEPSMADFEGWGHFSQLVWKDSTEIGCATQFCPKGTMFDSMDAWFMVCNYKPAGNMGGSYGANVLKPLGEKSVAA